MLAVVNSAPPSSPSIPRSHRFARSRPLTQAKGACVSPFAVRTPRHSRARGNPVGQVSNLPLRAPFVLADISPASGGNQSPSLLGYAQLLFGVWDYTTR